VLIAFAILLLQLNFFQTVVPWLRAGHWPCAWEVAGGEADPLVGGNAGPLIVLLLYQEP